MMEAEVVQVSIGELWVGAPKGGKAPVIWMEAPMSYMDEGGLTWMKGGKAETTEGGVVLPIGEPWTGGT
eukprot:scaffold56508_cov20-Tisochrysis_lutea.AAC.2